MYTDIVTRGWINSTAVSSVQLQRGQIALYNEILCPLQQVTGES